MKVRTILSLLRNECKINDNHLLLTHEIHIGELIHDNLKSSEIDCAYIYSGSTNQRDVAQKWNNDELQVLISTTLGLVGNESSKTQLVCIVGLLYDIPSVIQSIGRIRPKRRTRDSECIIFTKPDNRQMVLDSYAANKVKRDELIGCNILNKEHSTKYLKSMTIQAVNAWLVSDRGCRIVNLYSRFGYQTSRCMLCDHCTGTSVSRSALIRLERNNVNKCQKRDGITLLQRLKSKCIVCNSRECYGKCVAAGLGLSNGGKAVCFKCLGNHYSRNCKREYELVLRGKACYCCFQFNYSDECRHDFSQCSGAGGIKERLRALIQHDYCEKQENRGSKITFTEHLSGIFASSESFFLFLYKYRNRM